MRKKKYEVEDENRSLIRVYCKYCGHSQSIPVYVDSKICNYCHMLIKNTSRAYFRKKMMELVRGENNEGK